MPFERAPGAGRSATRPLRERQIIQELGERARCARAGWIVYTSADSVFQIAAHEERIPLGDLYRMCEVARAQLVGQHHVGRVIARPFTGPSGAYTRTPNRHDHAGLPADGTACGLAACSHRAEAQAASMCGSGPSAADDHVRFGAREPCRFEEHFCSTRSFARQALAEKRLTRGAGQRDPRRADGAASIRAFQRAMPVIAHEMDFLPRPLVEQLVRHVLRRARARPDRRLHVIRQVGRGGMGVVYLAEQLSLKRNVALKLLIRRDMSQKFVDRFKREGRACALIRHQNLVAAFDVGSADGWHYFSMEYVDGPTLRARCARTGRSRNWKRSDRPPGRRRCLPAPMTTASSTATSSRATSWSTRTGIPKLCDLGLARIRNVDESELYEPGTTLGSRRYMSPEQARGLEGIDARSDIYSLGLTLFFMLTGVPPFSDVPKEEVMLEHIRGLLEWPSDVNPEHLGRGPRPWSGAWRPKNRTRRPQKRAATRGRVEAA